MGEHRELSLDSLRSFLLDNSGKVTQSNLTDCYKDFLMSRDETVKIQSRREFKEMLNLITVAKEESGTKYIYLVEQYRSNVAYKNANLQGRLQVLLEKKSDHQHPSTPCRCRSRTATNRTRSESESSESSESPCHDKRKLSTEHRMRRLSAITILKNVFQIKSKSCERLNSEENEFAFGLEDEIHPVETKWLAVCCGGELDEMITLLKEFPNLLDRNDFIHGYTALHWAAKRGRVDITEFIVANQTSKDSINNKSHGGYTALHVASFCGKDEVISKLIDLGADIQARDHHGKKPKDIVLSSVKSSVQRKLGRPLVIDTNTVLNTGVSFSRNKHGRYSLDANDRRGCQSPERRAKRSKSCEREVAREAPGAATGTSVVHHCLDSVNKII